MPPCGPPVQGGFFPSVQESEIALNPKEVAEERRRGRFAAAAAAGSAILFPGGLLWFQAVNQDRPDDNAPAELRFYDDRATELLAASAIRSLGLLLLIAVALHLYRATKARNPALSPIVAFLGVFGPAALALGGLVHDAYLAFAAADFSDREFQTISDAENLTDSSLRLAAIGLSIAGTLGLAFWFVLGSLNAMRVGLLTRFMGVLGVIVGAAFILTLAPPITTFWLLALAALFLGRWPRAMPPAWETGRALPWPPARERPPEQQPAGAIEEVGGSRNGEVDAVGPGVRHPDGENLPPADEPAAEGTPSARRRKRKRRR